ncbi:hypothetical protein [Jiangella mangrovi]|uniref:Uncharacterized protein n=1 Tax=Jiangella mangrovi TaxID=1524084 RepID=A0A7W9LQ02_9ACTN|nr:hypothetical protein [Jiangella mangrovi]MBB5791789.1 hypothetical protein [Jiangella mangrovi]
MTEATEQPAKKVWLRPSARLNLSQDERSDWKVSSLLEQLDAGGGKLRRTVVLEEIRQRRAILAGKVLPRAEADLDDGGEDQDDSELEGDVEQERAQTLLAAAFAGEVEDE